MKLHTLWSNDNLISTLLLPNTPTLTTIQCDTNRLTALDVSHYPNLVTLTFNHNSITSLDLSNNTALGILQGNVNKLTSLNLLNNSALANASLRQSNLLDIGGDFGSMSHLWAFRADGQVVTIPVYADSANPGNFVSSSTYDFAAGHTITLASSNVHYNPASRRFSTTTLDTAVGFITATGANHTVEGTVTFVLIDQGNSEDANDSDNTGAAGSNIGGVASGIPAAGDTIVVIFMTAAVLLIAGAGLIIAGILLRRHRRLEQI